jgi:hypothetical protein
LVLLGFFAVVATGGLADGAQAASTAQATREATATKSTGTDRGRREGVTLTSNC